MPNPAALELWAMGAFGTKAFTEDLRAPTLRFITEDVEIGPDIWRIRRQRYDNPQWNSVWRHTVTAELTQAIGRLRPLSNPATIYVVTNEPLTDAFRVQAVLAEEVFPELAGNERRSDFAVGVAQYKELALKLAQEGKRPSNQAIAELMGVAGRTITAYRTEARKDPEWCRATGVPAQKESSG